MADTAAIERLRNYATKRRLDLRLSQAELAEAGGLSRATIAHFETGRIGMPTRETLIKLAKGLGVPYSALEAVINGDDPGHIPSAEAARLAQRIVALKPEDQAVIDVMIARFEQLSNQ